MAQFFVRNIFFCANFFQQKNRAQLFSSIFSFFFIVRVFKMPLPEKFDQVSEIQWFHDSE